MKDHEVEYGLLYNGQQALALKLVGDMISVSTLNDRSGVAGATILQYLLGVSVQYMRQASEVNASASSTTALNSETSEGAAGSSIQQGEDVFSVSAASAGASTAGNLFGTGSSVQPAPSTSVPSSSSKRSPWRRGMTRLAASPFNPRRLLRSSNKVRGLNAAIGSTCIR